jgi:4-amino-4-deoxy-L-arabinose transferase-like glycosyltransferase
MTVELLTPPRTLRTTAVWFGVVMLSALLLRLFVYQTYHPADYSDTQGYIQMAHVITSGDWVDNLGARPPFYPLLLVLAGGSRMAVLLMQSLFGVVMAAIFYYTTLRSTGSSLAAGVAGLAAAVSLPELYFEAVLMSEVTSAFLLVLLLAAGGFLSSRPPASWRMAALLGLLAGLNSLTRPFFAYLGPLLVLIYWMWHRRERVSRRAVFSAALLLPYLLMVLGWSWVNLKTADVFSLTSLTGYNLINHTGAFIEYAPEEYGGVRDVYLKHRAERIRETGSQSMTIWRAYPELDPSGARYTAVSQELTALSVQLILRRPDLYLASAGQAWLNFWRVPLYWRAEYIQPAGLVPPLRVVWLVQRGIFLLANLAFLASGFLWLFKILRLSKSIPHLSARIQPGEGYLLAVFVLVLAGSIFQALIDLGENARYSFPFQVLIFWYVLQLAFRTFSRTDRK